MKFIMKKDNASLASETSMGMYLPIADANNIHCMYVITLYVHNCGDFVNNADKRSIIIMSKAKLVTDLATTCSYPERFERVLLT